MDGVVQLFEAWMPSFAPQMVLLTFAETKVRPAAGKSYAFLSCVLYIYALNFRVLSST